MAAERSVDLERGAARFAAWRAGRSRGERIPAALWELAVELAARHGVSRTAQAVGVGYYSLQERLAARRATSSRTAAVTPALTLIEVPVPASGGSAAGCTIEIEHPDGAKLRIQASAGATLDLAALVRAFREHG